MCRGDGLCPDGVAAAAFQGARCPRGLIVTIPPRKPPGRRAGAYAQTERVLALLARLQARRSPVRLDALADDLGISVKQLRRDLVVLAAAGHHSALLRLEGRSAVQLVRGKSESITLTLRERFALLAMRDVFAALEGTPLAEDAHAIFNKVAATLADDSALDLQRLGPRFLYIPDGGIKSYAEHADVVDELLTGALRRQSLDATYQPAHGKPLTGTLEPWAVALYRNGLYVVGRWDRDDAPRVFAVERFTAATRRRKTTFDVPADFSLATFFGGALGIFAGGVPEKIVVEFSKHVATIVTSRRWHPTQRTKVLRAGGVRMELDAPVTPDVVSWLVGWGAMVKVCEPTTLAQAVVAEHRAAMALGLR